MDKQTLSNYGWIVICVLVLAVMIALATPFGTFVKGATENTTQGLFDVHRTALGVAGIAIDERGFEDANSSGNDGGGGSEPPVEPEPVSAFQAEFDATHTEEVTLTMGYTFTYGDYEYRYNQYWVGSSWSNSADQNGWGFM